MAFYKMGIDYDMMRKILHIKLTMDERKVPTLFNQNKRKTIKSMATLSLYGFICYSGLYSSRLWDLVKIFYFR